MTFSNQKTDNFSRQFDTNTQYTDWTSWFSFNSSAQNSQNSFPGLPCSHARNTDTFQVVVYEAQFFLQCVMGRLLFLTHNKQEDFMLHVLKYKLHGNVCFKLDKNHKKGMIVTFDRSSY